jgi:hypothetical protein
MCEASAMCLFRRAFFILCAVRLYGIITVVNDQMKVINFLPGVVVHTFNPTTREAETEGSKCGGHCEVVSGQYGLYSEILSKKNICLYIKIYEYIWFSY